MERVKVNPLSLTYTITSESAYPDWVTSTRYYKGERIYNDPAGGGDGHDYELWYSQWQSTLRPDQYSYPWTDLGAATGDKTYDTNVDDSDYPAWGSGDIVKGERRYSEVTGHDYEALVDIDSVDNDLEPSAAVLSGNATIAGYWYDLGPSNRDRMFDGEADTKTTNNTTIEVEALGTGTCDRIAFVGMEDVKSITVDITAGEILTNWDFTGSNVSAWIEDTNATISHSSGNLRIVLSASASNEGGYTLVENLTPGTTYEMAGVVTTDSGDYASLKAYTGDSYTTTLATSTGVTGTSQTTSATFTPTGSKVRIRALGDVEGTYDWTSISLKEYNVATQNLSVTSLQYGTSGEYATIYKFEHTEVSFPNYDITMTSLSTDEELKCGLVVCGKAHELGYTQADAELGVLDFSNTERDVYGRVKFQKRGYAKIIRASVAMDTDQGDLVAHLVNQVRGEPAFWDFNHSDSTPACPSTSYTRLLAQGWADRAFTTIGPSSGQSLLNIDIQGIVE